MESPASQFSASVVEQLLTRIADLEAALQQRDALIAERFTFVEHPQVPSENNAAECSVRPRVMARKISGGTRSSAGSKTMVVLASLFET